MIGYIPSKVKPEVCMKEVGFMVIYKKKPKSKYISYKKVRITIDENT